MGKLMGKTFNDLFTIFCSFLTLLLFFYYASAYVPIGFNHGAVDSSVCLLSSLLYDATYIII